MVVQLGVAVIVGIVLGFVFGDLMGALVVGTAGVVIGGLLERMQRLEREIEELRNEVQQSD